MPLKNVKLEMQYWVSDEDDSHLVIDAIVQSVVEARAVAQTLLMTMEDQMPPPHIILQVTDEQGALQEIDIDKWQELRAAEQEEETTDE